MDLKQLANEYKHLHKQLAAEHEKIISAMESLLVDYVAIKQELIALKSAGREHDARN